MAESMAERVANHFLSDMNKVGIKYQDSNMGYEISKTYPWLGENQSTIGFYVGYTGDITAGVSIHFEQGLKDKSYLSSVDLSSNDFLTRDWGFFIKNPYVRFFVPYSTRTYIEKDKNLKMCESMHLLSRIRNWAQGHGRGIDVFSYSHDPPVGSRYNQNDYQREEFIIYPWLYNNEDVDYRKYFR